MILRCVCWSIFLCLALQRTAKAQVKIDEQGYQNMLISFAPNVPSKNGQGLVQSIQQLLESTSSVLQTAIGVRIASATFRLPSSWSIKGWENITVNLPTPEQTAGRPDINVDATEHSPFGKQPVALQHGGCGVAGHQITLPVDFVSSTDGNEYPKEKLLAREWLKHRYGVFDENGFAGDSLYPDYYRIPGSSEIRITECTNLEVNYTFKKPEVDEVCDMESEAHFGYCRAHPDEESTANVTSSLMYFHKGLPNMIHICGKDDHHHNTSRNKQNALCNGQSIWDVVKQSKDFETIQSDDSASETIQFSYIQESKPRFVVLLENSDNLLEKDVPIRFALRRFYYDLPAQSKFAVYTYNSDVATVMDYTELPADGRSDLNTIADFGTPATSICTSCGLKKATEILLQKSDVEKGSILLITASPLDTIPELPEKLKESGICLRVLRFTDESADDSYEALKGSFECFSSEPLQNSLDALQTFHSLSGFLTTDVPESNGDFEIKTIVAGEISGLIPMTISRDAMASLYTLWLGKGMGSSSIDCKAGETAVTLNPGKVTAEIVSFNFDPMDSDVTCKLGSTKVPSVLAQAQMTTKKGHYIEFDTWIHDLSTDTNQLPIIIYAKIYFGGYPVKNANVTMVVTSGENPVKIDKLLDNGRGGPDVTQYDGIYSGYFTGFVEKGEYQIAVKINSNEGQAKIGKENPSLKSAPCCGSIVISQEDEVPAFEMEKSTTYAAKNKRPETGYPPSKILDLQAAIDNSSQVILSWTAPGGDKAEGYTIKLFQNRENALLNFETTGTELNASNIVPGDSGAEEEFLISHDGLEEEVNLYAAVRSWNEFNKKSEISNIVEFITPKSGDGSTVGVSSTPGGITDDESARRARIRKRTIEIVVGVLAGIVVLCILVYLGVYFFVQKPRRKEEKARARKKAESGGGQRTVSAPSGQIGLNSIPADVIVKHHNEVEKAKSLHKDPPIFKEENLDSINSSPELPENTRRNNKVAEYTMVQKAPVGTAPNSSQQDPSKSPKRMTVV